jgi:sigma-B regulation protein RsbU (phosphoserine phosphatase)
MDGTRYKEYEIHMEPGDALFLYTDGATEATNSAEEAFGPERLLAALNMEPGSAEAETELENVKREIDRFAGEAPQFDDITMLCLRYLGENMKRLTIKAAVENLDRVLAFVDEQLEAAGCPMKTQMQIDVAVEEIFVNIAHYAYAPGTGNAVIGIHVDSETRTAVITFADSGIPYDPTAAEDPDVTLPAEEREVGGLGIFMVKKSMDDMRYEYKDGQNILTITKKI